MKVGPRETLTGSCTAKDNGLMIRHDPALVYNMYAVDIEYDCKLSSRDKELKSIGVLDFTADIQLII